MDLYSVIIIDIAFSQLIKFSKTYFSILLCNKKIGMHYYLFIVYHFQRWNIARAARAYQQKNFGKLEGFVELPTNKQTESKIYGRNVPEYGLSFQNCGYFFVTFRVTWLNFYGPWLIFKLGNLKILFFVLLNIYLYFPHFRVPVHCLPSIT